MIIATPFGSISLLLIAALVVGYFVIGGGYSLFDYFFYIRSESIKAKARLQKSIDKLTADDIALLKSKDFVITKQLTDLTNEEAMQRFYKCYEHLNAGPQRNTFSDIWDAMKNARNVLSKTPDIAVIFFWPFVFVWRFISEVSSEIYRGLQTAYHRIKLYIYTKVMNET